VTLHIGEVGRVFADVVGLANGRWLEAFEVVRSSA